MRSIVCNLQLVAVCNSFAERYVINPKEKYTYGDAIHATRDYMLPSADYIPILRIG